MNKRNNQLGSFEDAKQYNDRFSVAVFIYHLRIEEGLSLTKFAKKVNKPLSYMKKIEDADASVSFDELKEIAKVFNKDVDLTFN